MNLGRVLVTGGTGTFGRAFIRRIGGLVANEGQATVTGIVSYSRDEQKAADLTQEFQAVETFRAFLGDVRDRTRLTHAMRGVDTVVHAAALKRVEVGAYSPSELIATNIQGTINVIDTAIDAGVQRVVVLSSDKSVQPTNLYGATKHCAETYAVQSNSYGWPRGTIVTAVRYGNILGSRGSVYHTWRRQIAHGEPITVVGGGMTRFVMTIEQAVDLVLVALRIGEGGEVFVPALPRATIETLATAVLARYGRQDWPMTQIPLRPGGEKFAEVLFSDEELSRTVEVGRHALGGGPRVLYDEMDIYAIQPSQHEWKRLAPQAHCPRTTLSCYRSDRSGSLLDLPALAALLSMTEACA